MGTDISMQTEVRREGKWCIVRNCDAPQWVAGMSEDQRSYDRNAPAMPLGYESRNYDLFAVLADVRNEFDARGAETSERRECIDTARGLPANMADAGLDEYGDPLSFAVGGHSESWVTLAELLAFDVDRTVISCGVVSVPQFVAWKAAGTAGPQQHFRAVGGSSVVHVSLAEMEHHAATAPETRYTYTKVCWRESYRSLLGPEWFRFLDVLATLGRPIDVRIVFSFDS